MIIGKKTNKLDLAGWFVVNGIIESWSGLSRAVDTWKTTPKPNCDESYSGESSMKASCDEALFLLSFKKKHIK